MKKEVGTACRECCCLNCKNSSCFGQCSGICSGEDGAVVFCKDYLENTIKK